MPPTFHSIAQVPPKYATTAIAHYSDRFPIRHVVDQLAGHVAGLLRSQGLLSDAESLVTVNDQLTFLEKCAFALDPAICDDQDDFFAKLADTHRALCEFKLTAVPLPQPVAPLAQAYLVAQRGCKLVDACDVTVRLRDNIAKMADAAWIFTAIPGADDFVASTLLQVLVGRNSIVNVTVQPYVAPSTVLGESFHLFVENPLDVTALQAELQLAPVRCPPTPAPDHRTVTFMTPFAASRPALTPLGDRTNVNGSPKFGRTDTAPAFNAPLWLTIDGDDGDDFTVDENLLSGKFAHASPSSTTVNDQANCDDPRMIEPNCFISPISSSLQPSLARIVSQRNGGLERYETVYQRHTSRIFASFLDLLFNTRNDLAMLRLLFAFRPPVPPSIFATTSSVSISQQMTSFFRKIKLGGKGYQDADSPLIPFKSQLYALDKTLAELGTCLREHLHGTPIAEAGFKRLLKCITGQISCALFDRVDPLSCQQVEQIMLADFHALKTTLDIHQCSWPRFLRHFLDYFVSQNASLSVHAWTAGSWFGDVSLGPSLAHALGPTRSISSPAAAHTPPRANVPQRPRPGGHLPSPESPASGSISLPPALAALPSPPAFLMAPVRSLSPIRTAELPLPAAKKARTAKTSSKNVKRPAKSAPILPGQKSIAGWLVAKNPLR